MFISIQKFRFFSITRNLKSPKLQNGFQNIDPEATVIVKEDTIKASIRLVVLFGILVKKTEFRTHFVQSHIFQFSRKIQNQTSQVCLWNVLYMILASSTCNACDKINKRSSSSPELQILIFLWQDQEHSNNIPVTESNAYVSDPVL